jgi:hypothetical protein
MKTLQQQYNLIKEGKGDKSFFIRQALRQFPEWITVNNTFEQTVSILKGKSIISEGAGGVVTNSGRKDWFKIFEAEVKAMKLKKLIKKSLILKLKTTIIKTKKTLTTYMVNHFY